jgi:hypothetical protein
MISRHAPRCSAEGCCVPLKKGQLFCADHYYALPRPMRDALWRAWRQAMENWSGKLSLAEQMRREQAYGEAFRAAVEHLRAAPPTPPIARTATATDATGATITYVEGRML